MAAICCVDGKGGGVIPGLRHERGTNEEERVGGVIWSARGDYSSHPGPYLTRPLFRLG